MHTAFRFNFLGKNRVGGFQLIIPDTSINYSVLSLKNYIKFLFNSPFNICKVKTLIIVKGNILVLVGT